MTTEEAIARIEDHMQVHGIGEYPHLRLKEALDMAIAALRAQQEPVRLDRSRWEGCEVCLTIGAPENWEDGIRFCPHCGKPITEEAWAELERGINGGTAD